MNECLLATALAPKLRPNCSKEELVDVLQAFVRERTEQREHEKLTMKWKTRTSAYSEQVSESIPSHFTKHIDYIRSNLRAVEPTKSHLPYLADGD
jgi:hypothetical protein